MRERARESESEREKEKEKERREKRYNENVLLVEKVEEISGRRKERRSSLFNLDLVICSEHGSDGP